MSLTRGSKRRKEDKENVIIQPVSEGDLDPAVGCFDLKMRHNMSTSPHQNSAAATLAKLFSIFRSKSDPTVKSDSNKAHTRSPSKTQPKHGDAGVPHRRFVRVVRDEKAQAPEVVDDNPHVICRYSQGFLKEHYHKSQEEPCNRPLPYVTSGHTILKKSSTAPTSSYLQPSPTDGKHATFKELVKIIEYSGQDVLETGQTVSHEAQLHDESVSPTDESREPGFFIRNDAENIDDQETVASSLDDDAEEDVSTVPAADLDRMDGIMRNIFSSVANVHQATPEPPKIRRVELSELINQHDSEE